MPELGGLTTTWLARTCSPRRGPRIQALGAAVGSAARVRAAGLALNANAGPLTMKGPSAGSTCCRGRSRASTPRTSTSSAPRSRSAERCAPSRPTMQRSSPRWGRRELVRVWVKDSSGTFRDLTTYPGVNLVAGVTWKETVDADGLDCDIQLKRETASTGTPWRPRTPTRPPGSPSPWRTSSPLNLGFNPAGSRAARRARPRGAGRVAIIPLDGTPAAGDWKLVFWGYVDNIDFGADPMTLQCRDLSARIRTRTSKKSGSTATPRASTRRRAAGSSRSTPRTP